MAACEPIRQRRVGEMDRGLTLASGTSRVGAWQGTNPALVVEEVTDRAGSLVAPDSR